MLLLLGETLLPGRTAGNRKLCAVSGTDAVNFDSVGTAEELFVDRWPGRRRGSGGGRIAWGGVS